jgi:hypothetical protein
MDIYGAFQLCAIGILAAPVTVMLSKTYFNDPGRNTIFLWTFLLLIGNLNFGNSCSNFLPEVRSFEYDN